MNGKNTATWIGFVVIGIILITSVSAMSPESYSNLNFIEKLKYDFSSGGFFGLFTTWGQANDCSEYPDEEKILEYGDRVDCDDADCDYDKCAIDIWFDEVIYLGGNPPYDENNVLETGGADRLVWYDEEGGEGESFTVPSGPDYWYVEIYCCPEDSDVDTSHSTTAYRCESGSWNYKGTYDSDEYCSYDPSGVDLCWCSDDNDNFYIDESGYVHCRQNPDSSWCSSCVSHDSYKCYSGDIYWYDSCGDIEDFKESCSEGCATGASSCYDIVYNDADVNHDGSIDRAELRTYIERWRSGSATRTELGNVITIWAAQ